MAHEVRWTKTILDEFVREGQLTDEEIAIMQTRIAGMTRTQQSFYFNISLSTLDKKIARLKQKYDSAQAHSDILPPRRSSVYEKYQDEN